MTTVAIVTGSGRGMGLACAQRLSAMVDALLLVDLDEATLKAVTDRLSSSGGGALIEPFVLDVTDRDGQGRLATRVGELGTLRAVAHAAGISPTMADWRRVFAVDLVGTALLAEALRPLATAGTATVFFASMAPILGIPEPIPAADAALDAPLDEGFLDRIHDALGSAVEDTGVAYAWAKRGVQRLAQREAVRVGPAGARVCSVSPGIVDTPRAARRRSRTPTWRCWCNGRRSGVWVAPTRSPPPSPSSCPTTRASSRASTSSSTGVSAPPCADPRLDHSSRVLLRPSLRHAARVARTSVVAEPAARGYP
jgi:NAD(P)-dependent dehydrogenase (short-subunit alcohol dehydrogenase family)